jgi:hypothetical protein
LGVFILEKQLTNIPDRGFLFLRNTLLLYSLSPYSWTERRTESQINPGWAATLTGSFRLILVGLGNLRFLQVNWIVCTMYNLAPMLFFILRKI